MAALWVEKFAVSKSWDDKRHSIEPDYFLLIKVKFNGERDFSIVCVMKRARRTVLDYRRVWSALKCLIAEWEQRLARDSLSLLRKSFLAAFNRSFSPESQFPGNCAIDKKRRRWLRVSLNFDFASHTHARTRARRSAQQQPCYWTISIEKLILIETSKQSQQIEASKFIFSQDDVVTGCWLCLLRHWSN